MVSNVKNNSNYQELHPDRKYLVFLEIYYVFQTFQIEIFTSNEYFWKFSETSASALFSKSKTRMRISILVRMIRGCGCDAHHYPGVKNPRSETSWGWNLRRGESSGGVELPRGETYGGWKILGAKHLGGETSGGWKIVGAKHLGGETSGEWNIWGVINRGGGLGKS